MPEMQMNDREANSLLKAVDRELSSRIKPVETGPGADKRMAVDLEDRELWSKFKEHTNEMIVTKSGRYVMVLLRAIKGGGDDKGTFIDVNSVAHYFKEKQNQNIKSHIRIRLDL